jgi:Putative ABC-transporter type IV
MMLRHFVAYGLLGWCAEIAWTAAYDFVTRTRRAEGDSHARVPLGRAERWRLQGRSYLWMFPIYGLAAVLFDPVHDAVRAWAWPLRGALYTAGAFAVEGAAGLALRALTGRCPWDYSYARWHVKGVIRLDYIPVWFAFGMLLERVQDFLRAIDTCY